MFKFKLIPFVSGRVWLIYVNPWLDYILAWSSELIDVTLISILKMNSFPNIGGLSNKVAVAGVNSENKFKSRPKVSAPYVSIFFYLRNSHLHKHDVKSPQNTGQYMSSSCQNFIFNKTVLWTLYSQRHANTEYSIQCLIFIHKIWILITWKYMSWV